MLGSSLAPFVPLLKRTGGVARYINCDRCGCFHERVTEADSAKIVAVCRCETATCEDMVLDRESGRLVALDWTKLSSVLCDALPATVRAEQVGVTPAWHIGEATLRADGEAIAVVACFSGNGSAMRNAALAVSTEKLGRTVFVCKSGKPREIEALLPDDSRVVGFDDVWKVDGDKFSHGKSARRLFTGWDDEALQTPSKQTGNVRFIFKRRGDMWEVIYEGHSPFFIKDTLGARYIEYLLYHPNDPISSFDLEVAVTPEKAEARGETTIQTFADPQAVKSYLKTLTTHRAEREEAAADGDEAAVRRLDDEIEALETTIKEAEGGGASDRGERARMNVGKAIAAVRRKLASGSAIEKSFSKHLEDMLSTGYECAYRSAAGRIWQ